MMLKLVTPFLTSESTPFGHSCSTVSSLGGYEGWKCFDGDSGTLFVSALYAITGDFVRKYPKPFMLDTYSIRGRDDYSGQSPRDWTLSGTLDGTNWVLIDTRAGVQLSGEVFFKTNNRKKFLTYKLTVTSTNGAGDRLSITDIKFYTQVKSQVSKSLLTLPSVSRL